MLSINQVFNEEFYLEVNSEAAEAVEQGEFPSGLDHFLEVGVDQGLQFSPFIDIDYYQRVANPDLSDLSNREAFDHLLDEGIESGRLFSPFVDLEFYKEANPELSDLSNSEALIHLQDIGLEAGLQFSDFVNLEEYRAFNSELSTQSLSDVFVNLATQFAPDDEGRIRFPLNAARTSFIEEVDIVTPEMLEGGVDATITYSKAENTVTMDFEFTGLPYQLDLTRPEDVSTPYNQFPVEIQDGQWQLWLLTDINTIESNFWYDGETGDLIGNEFDLFDVIPEETSGIDVNNDGVEDQAISFPVIKQLSTPIFEGNPDGTASVSFEFDYDQMLDEQGKGGALFTELPYNINQPEDFGPYYTEGGLPVSEAPTFDDILQTMRSPLGFSIGHSLEPEVKPDYLASRSSLMIGFTNFYPDVIPEDVIFEPIINLYRPTEAEDLETNINEPTPARLAAIEAETEEFIGSSDDDVFEVVDASGEFDGNLDTVFAGGGDDLIDASEAVTPGFPSLAGNNSLNGEAGNDTVAGGFQDDEINGGDGDDLLRGDGNSRSPGGTVGGNDTIDGGDGNDRIGGKAGDDLLFGGEGDDQIWGDDGNDTIDGGLGDDILTGDDASGGQGADTFVLNVGSGVDTITDFEVGIDQIDLSGTDATSLDDVVLTQDGADTRLSLFGNDLAILENTQVSDLQASDGENLIVNGDFELGNTGFSSDYILTETNSATNGEGEYTVGDDPKNFNPLAVSFGDHTTGDGLMLIGNAAVESEVVAWSQTVDVLTGEDYSFSAFIAEWGSLESDGNTDSLSPAVLEFRINGEVIGEPTSTPLTAGPFEEFSAIWNSGSSTTATIEIVETTNIAFGNDFAIDDISFAPVDNTFLFA